MLSFFTPRLTRHVKVDILFLSFFSKLVIFFHLVLILFAPTKLKRKKSKYQSVIRWKAPVFFLSSCSRNFLRERKREKRRNFDFWLLTTACPFTCQPLYLPTSLPALCQTNIIIFLRSKVYLIFYEEWLFVITRSICYEKTFLKWLFFNECVCVCQYSVT